LVLTTMDAAGGVWAKAPPVTIAARTSTIKKTKYFFFIK